MAVLAVYGAEPFSAEKQTKVFGKILWDAYCFGKIEGTDHGVPDTYGQESTYFALYDVDGDGQEELLLNWTRCFDGGYGRIYLGIRR